MELIDALLNENEQYFVSSLLGSYKWALLKLIYL